ncbi:hypothetical protein DLAC_00696 [Tieghemostelium lacteum]|uniref:Transmembrane protein n=1 Tax=Tieghemostelium lacteum TaxID=361077 RepID=A0A152A8I7_TIELA|nr:hypothetical protein DLAC_00696 [Tieghemostelium lacteum]|eukprot:KYR02560.1 hypothetical protein DLAC_00696 [Tieghemostelium lacteum]
MHKRHLQNLNYVLIIVTLCTIVDAVDVNPILRFSKNMLTPDSNHQLRCIGGSAQNTDEEAAYLICRSSLADIYSENVIWKCQGPISKKVQLSQLKINCPKLENVVYSYGDDHPCSVEYHLDWIEYRHEFSKVLGWSLLGIIFFYLLLKRNNTIYNTQINNPMSLPREQINPKVFRGLGIMVIVIVVIATIAFILLCLFMFSAPL